MMDASGNTHFPSPQEPPASSDLVEIPTLRKKPQKSFPSALSGLSPMSPDRPVVPKSSMAR